MTSPATTTVEGMPCENRSQVDLGAALGGWIGVSASKARLREMVHMKGQEIGYHSIELFFGKNGGEDLQEKGPGVD